MPSRPSGLGSGSKPGGMSKWKLQSMQFRLAMQAARQSSPP
jgi:hypothetical protein